MLHHRDGRTEKSSLDECAVAHVSCVRSACISGIPLHRETRGGTPLIVLGVIVLILGLVLNAGILSTIGLILIGVGIVLAILGMLDRAVGPRRYYY